MFLISKLGEYVEWFQRDTPPNPLSINPNTWHSIIRDLFLWVKKNCSPQKPIKFVYSYDGSNFQLLWEKNSLKYEKSQRDQGGLFGLGLILTRGLKM